MATTTQTIGNVNSGSGASSTKVLAFYDKVLLKTLAQREFKHQDFGQKRPMPKRSGDTVNFRRVGKLAINTTPLTEGVTPNSDSASITAITATTAQYGRFLEFSDLIDIQQIDNIVAEYVVELGRVMSETLDTLTRDVLLTSTNVFYEDGTSPATVTLKPSLKTFRKAALALKRSYVKGLNGGDYVALISPTTSFDLLDDPDFQKAMQYGQNAKPMYDNEIGRIYNIRFVECLNAKSNATQVASILLGDQGYGITKIEGEDAKTIIKTLGDSGTSDPLNQRQTIGIKINAFVAKILTPEAVAVIWHKPTNAIPAN
jgi:N4-gp56 family major capsid protein